MAGMTKNWAGDVALSHATLHDSRILKPELISATAWRRKGRRERRRCVPRKCTVWTRAGAARLDGLQPSQKNVRRKIPPNGHTRLKFGFSYEISQHNDFRYFRHQFHSTFPRHSTKPMFRSFPMTPLMRWGFQHTCRRIWRFRGCLRHSPKGKKPNNWLQEAWWYIRLSQSVLVILTMN